MNRSSPVNRTALGRRSARPGRPGRRGTGRPAIPRSERPASPSSKSAGSTPARESSAAASSPVHRQLGDPDLEQPALGPEQRRRERQRVPRPDRQLRTRREPERQCGDDVPRLPVRHRLEVVDDEGHRVLHRGDRRCQTRRAVDPRTRPGDASHGLDDVGQEHEGVVVAAVGRDPCRPGARARGELRQQCRLAVARWSDHGDDRHRCRLESVDEAVTGHDPGSSHRDVELRLQEVERRRRRQRDRTVAGARRTGAVSHSADRRWRLAFPATLGACGYHPPRTSTCTFCLNAVVQSTDVMPLRHTAPSSSWPPTLYPNRDLHPSSTRRPSAPRRVVRSDA